MFWSRDFAFCVDALLKQKYSKQVKSTLAYALEKYEKAGRVTTSITPDHVPYDFPNYAVDSLPLLLYSLRAANAKQLVKKHKKFLEHEIEKFQLEVLAENGMVRTDRYFSSMKDYSLRQSSCYDNSMAALLQKEAKTLGFKYPIKANYKKLLKDELWTGEYFLDDVSGKYHVAGDANTFPFWTGVITDKSMMRSAFAAVQRSDLDKPFPLRYTSNAKVKMRKESWLTPNYERNSVWLHMGPLFMNLMKKVDRQQYIEYRVTYHRIVEHYGTLLEVYTPEGKPYKSLFYMTDEGMLWAANLI